MYRIHQIKLSLDENLGDIPNKIKAKFKGKKLDILEWHIVKESIDARKKSDIKKVYTVDFKSNIELPLETAKKPEYQNIRLNKELDYRPVVVGFGPCGIFAALVLAQGGARPIIIERGKPIDERAVDVELYWRKGVLNQESNVQFGEGGAGTFSDGKLTTGIKDIRIHKVVQELIRAGASKEIRYKQKPHIGTDLLKGIITNIREEIIRLGGEIHFSSKLTGLEIVDGKIHSIDISKIGKSDKQKKIVTRDVVVAIGHSSRDTFEIMRDCGFAMEQKPFSVGVRISHLQEKINKAQYGEDAMDKLPPAEYKLSHRCANGRGVYTFCMCPGGEIIEAATEEKTIVVNGMSYHSRDGRYANSGLLVDVRTSDFESEDPLAGVEFQRKYEKLTYELGSGKAPETTYGDFKNSIVAKTLPKFVAESILEAMPHLGKKLKGFDDPDTKMVAIETRSSSPVRIFRDSQLQSNVQGVYPAGEGAGYAGGIVSAAVDGIKVAEAILQKYKSMDTI